MAKPTTHIPIGIHPGVRMAQRMLERLDEKTGRSLEEWGELLEKTGLDSVKDRAAWLKSRHKVGTNYARTIAQRSLGLGAEESDPEAYRQAAGKFVEAQYAGKKAHLRPVYAALLQVCVGLGDGVTVCPCKTIVPLYRNHVFAEIKPATQQRIDFGLALKGVKGKLPKRLIDTGGLEKGDRITHRFALESVEDVDEGVRKWAAAAYKRDA